MTKRYQQLVEACVAFVIMLFSLFFIPHQPTTSIVNLIGSLLFLDICLPETQSDTHWVKVCGSIATIGFILSIILDLVELARNF